MALRRRIVSSAGGHLSGARNGCVTGSKLSIAPRSAKRVSKQTEKTLAKEKFLENTP
jgi:hypothetical protein